jgi:hypothetical protein
MNRAHTMLQNGFREEAIRLALVAEQIETSQPGLYAGREGRPSDFVAKVRATDPGANLLASANDHELESLLRETRAHSARRKPRIEMTDIAAGWQAVEAPSTPSRGERSATTLANRGRTEIAALDHAAAAEADRAAGSVQVAHAASDVTPASQPLAGIPEPPAPPAIESAGALSPAADSVVEELADNEPLADVDETSKLPVNLTAASVAGLIAGLAGLLGLSYWRRQEQKHYARSGA